MSRSLALAAFLWVAATVGLDAHPLDDPANATLYMGPTIVPADPSPYMVQFNTSKLKKNFTTIIPVGDVIIPLHKPAQVVYVPGAWSHVKIGDQIYYAPTHGMAAMVKAMVENAPNKDQILIAHSLGGLRAIGYANVMHRLGFGDRIKGIIFIGSPIRGMPASLGGAQAFDTRLAGLVSDIESLFTDAISELGTLRDYLQAFNVVTLDIKDLDDKAAAVRDGIEVMKSSSSQITGLKRFLDDYKNQFQISDRLLSEVDPNGVYFQAYLGRQFPTKDTFSSVLPPTVKVGFVVGTDSNVLDLLSPSGAEVPNFGTLNKTAIQAKIDEYKRLLINPDSPGDGKIKQLQDGRNDIEPWKWLLFGQETYDSLGRSIDRLQDIHNFLNHLEDSDSIVAGFLNADGYFADTRNDGFIPVGSQSRTIAELGGAPITSPYRIEILASHSNVAETTIGELTAPGIWGQGRFQGTQIIPELNNGIIPSFFYTVTNDPSVPSRDRRTWKEASTHVFLNVDQVPEF